MCITLHLWIIKRHCQ